MLQEERESHRSELVLDGVFSEARPAPLTFYPAPPPSDQDVAHALATARARVGKLPARHQLEPDDDTAPADSLAEPHPPCPASLAPPSRAAAPSRGAT